MTNEEINKLVAENIMGWKVINEEYSVVNKDGFPEEFRPSEYFEDAFMVWNKLNDKDFYLQVEQESDFTFVVYLYDGYYEETTNISLSGEDKSFSMAICKAALKIAGIEIDI